MKSKVDQQFEKLLNGQFNDLPERYSNLVRIFLSSTFTDTHEERDYLIENVYPKLRKYCIETYGLDFQVIDMRWGITDELTINNLTSSICLNEILNCKKYSIGPYFTAILSHKYGQRPLQSRIDEVEYLQIKSEIENNKNLDICLNYKTSSFTLKVNDLFDYCYKLDENEIPKCYKLLNTNVIIQNYSLQNPDHKKVWNLIQEKLQTAFRYAADKLFQDDKRDKYFVSITEQEIYNGVLGVDDVENRAFVFIREIENIDKKSSSERVLHRFIESNDESTLLLDKLKHKLRSKLSSNCVLDFKVLWSSDGITRKTHLSFMNEFGISFFNLIKRSIDESVNKLNSLNVLTGNDKELYQELIDHGYLCKSTAEKFHGRQDLLNKINKYVYSNENVGPLTIFGDSGTGKTSLIAITVYNLIRSDEDFVVIVRFLGTTRSTSNATNTLKSIISQLNRIFQLDIPIESVSNNLLELRDFLSDCLLKIKKEHPKKKIILFLDSIDQLSESDFNVEWILAEIPDNTKLVYTTLETHGNILENMRQKIADNSNNYIKVSSLDRATVIEIINDWLQKSNRTLSTKQWKILNNLFKKATLYPLYVKLIYDIVVKWPSYYLPDEVFYMCTNIDECIRYYLRLLEGVHSKIVFSRCMFYLTMFTNGLSENELEDVLSIDDYVLESVFQYHEPPIRRFPVALWTRIKYDLKEYLTEKEIDDTRVIYWFHRRFIEISKELYIDSLSENEHSKLVLNVLHYFIGTWNEKKKPFMYSEHVRNKIGVSSNEDYRYTRNQQIEYYSKDNVLQYNKRKLNELPRFILKLKDRHLKMVALKTHVYYNYTFMHAKAVLKNLSFLDEMTDTIWDCYNYYEEDGLKRKLTQFKNPFRSLVILHLIYQKNFLLIQEYPDALAFQAIAKLLDILRCEKEFNLIVQKWINESLRHCSLAPLNSYMPLTENANATTLLYDNEKIEYLVSLEGYPHIFCISDKIIVFDDTNSRVYGTLELKTKTKSTFRVYLKKLPDMHNAKVKDFHGGIIIISSHELYSINLSNETVYFHKVFQNLIDQVYVLSTTYCLVSQERTDFIEIYNIQSGQVVEKKSFHAKVRSVVCNVNNQQVFLPKDECRKLFVIVILETNHTFVYEFSNERTELDLTYEIPSQSKTNYLSCAINECYFKDVQDKNCLLKFSILFQNGDLFLFSILNDRTINCTHVKIVTVVGDENCMALDSNETCIVDYNYDLILLRIGRYAYVYNTSKNKFMISSKNFTYAKIVSNYSLIVFLSNDRVTLQKYCDYTNDDSDYQVLPIDHHKTSSSVTNRYRMVLSRNGQLISACEDKSVKKFDLNNSFLSDSSDTKMSTLFSGILQPFGNEHILIKQAKNKVAIINTKSLKLVETVTTNLDEIKQVRCLNDVCVLLCSKKNKTFVGYINTILVYIADYQDNEITKLFLDYSFSTLSRSGTVLHFMTIYNKISQKLVIQSYDYKENKIVVLMGNYDKQNCKWSYDMKDFLLASLKVTNKPLNDQSIICVTTSHVIVYYDSKLHTIDMFNAQLVDKLDIGKIKIDDIKTIECTNNVLIFDNSSSELYFCGYDEKLNKFMLNHKPIACSKFVMQNNIVCLMDNKSLILRIYDMYKTKGFEKAIFKMSYSESSILASISTNCKYLATFELPRTLTVFKLDTMSKIAVVPINDEVKELTISDTYLTVKLQNYKIFSFIILDETNKSAFVEMMKHNEDSYQNTKNLNLNNLIDQVNPKKSRSQNISDYDYDVFENKNVKSSIRNKIKTFPFLTNITRTDYKNVRFNEGWFEELLSEADAGRFISSCYPKHQN